MRPRFSGCGRQRAECSDRVCLREAAARCSLWPGAQIAKTHWPRRGAGPSFPQKVAGFYTIPSKKVHRKCRAENPRGRRTKGNPTGRRYSSVGPVDPQHGPSFVDTRHWPEWMRRPALCRCTSVGPARCRRPALTFRHASATFDPRFAQFVACALKVSFRLLRSLLTAKAVPAARGKKS
jgi:hypothetical protein